MFQFRSAYPSDDPQILQLFEAAFKKKFSQEWWNWYKANPVGANRHRVATSGECLAGSYGLLPLRLKLGEKIVDASLCQNVCTHPDFQGQGLFTQIGKYSLASEKDYQTQVSLGMPNANALPGHMKVGWDVISPLPFLVKKEPTVKMHPCNAVNMFSSDINPFLKKIQDRFAFIPVKTHKELNWRFIMKPGANYKVFLSQQVDQEITGYIVVKQFESGGIKKGHILEMHADTDLDLRKLLAAAETYADGCCELNMWTNPKDPYRDRILELGYEERESTDRLIFHTNYGEKIMVPEGPLYFSLSDNDVY